MNEINLKPCPFCGDRAVLETRKSAMFPGKYASHVYCMSQKCGADVWFYGNESNPDKVRELFNRRVTK